jgi:hypothetical protein
MAQMTVDNRGEREPLEMFAEVLIETQTLDSPFAPLKGGWSVSAWAPCPASRTRACANPPEWLPVEGDRTGADGWLYARNLAAVRRGR